MVFFSSNFYWSLLYIISMVTTEVQYSHCHPPSSTLGSTPLPLMFNGFDWNPQEHLVLTVPCMAKLILL